MSNYEKKINKDEALILADRIIKDPQEPQIRKDLIETLLAAYNEAHEKVSNKWCYDCKEYDDIEKCCHRYCNVIRNAVNEINEQQNKKILKIKALIQEARYIDGAKFEENANSTGLREALEIIDKVMKEDVL